MAVTWITRTEITPGSATAWTDADVSGSVPVGGTGVILHITSVAADYAIGWRKNGSTDNRTGILDTGSHFWCAVGIDGDRILELYVGNTTNVDVWLVGYFTSDAVFNTNAVDKSLGGTGSWLDIDISADTGGDTAIGAIWEITQTNYSQNWGLRKNGSTDSRVLDHDRHCGAIIGVDGSEVCEGQISSTDVDFWLTGYIVSDATFITNATDLSLGSTGSWIDLSALPAGGTGGYIEVITTHWGQTYGLRENGSAENIVKTAAEQHTFGMVEADGSRLIEGQISNVGVDFFLVGYSTGGAVSVTVTPSAIAMTGALGGPVPEVRKLLAAVAATGAPQTPVPQVTQLPAAIGATGALNAPVPEVRHIPAAVGVTGAPQTPVPEVRQLLSAIAMTGGLGVPTPEVRQLVAAIGATLAPGAPTPAVTQLPATIGVTGALGTPVPEVRKLVAALGVTGIPQTPTVVTGIIVEIAAALGITAATQTPTPAVTIEVAAIALAIALEDPTINTGAVAAALLMILGEDDLYA